MNLRSFFSIQISKFSFNVDVHIELSNDNLGVKYIAVIFVLYYFYTIRNRKLIRDMERRSTTGRRDLTTNGIQRMIFSTLAHTESN